MPWPVGLSAQLSAQLCCDVGLEGPQPVTEPKLALPTARRASKSGDELLGQGITILIGQLGTKKMAD